MKMPSGVSRATFDEAIAAFKAAIGAEWVFVSDEDVDLYRDSYSVFKGSDQELEASAAVAPASTEEVQAVVRIANAHKIPVYPISTGKDLGYGGSAPTYSGAVVIDLKRMNRVLEVNEEMAYCLVEPGVSYFDLYDYIQERKIKLWIDTPDPGWGSPIGNALDRGGGYTMPEFRNHFDAHCGMEVVLANGEVMRTGMGAMPNAKTWQQYKSGYGPWIDGLFSQSNFGIVTKMGFWLMPQPEAMTSVQINCYRFGDLNKLIELMNRTENSRIFNGLPDLSSPMLNAPAIRDLIHFNADGPAPVPTEVQAMLARSDMGYSPELDAYALRTRTPYWRLDVVCYGAPEMVEGQRAALKRMFAQIPDSTFDAGEVMTTPLSPEQQERLHNTLYGKPELRIFGLSARKPWSPAPPFSGHVFFSPLVPRTGEAIMEFNRVIGKAVREMGLPMPTPFIMPIFTWERAAMCVTGFFVTEDDEANAKMRGHVETLIKLAADHGWGEYRAAPAFQTQIMNTYSFNNNILRRFHETVKDAIDPNGIISPGRYGIWPRHLREG